MQQQKQEPKPYIPEEQFPTLARAAWNQHPKIRAEFGQFETYLAFCRVERRIVTS